MNVDLCLSNEFSAKERNPEGSVVLIDVLRASSFIPVALYHGASEVVLIEDEHEARAIKATHPDVVLAGERSGVKLDGFDLGNNPAKLEGLVQDKRVVLSSGNFCSVVGKLGEYPVIAGSLVNADAVAEYLVNHDTPAVTLVSTGTYNFRGKRYETPQFREEDDLGGLVIVQALMQRREGVCLTPELDASYQRYQEVLKRPSLLKLVLLGTPYAQELHRQDRCQGVTTNQDDMEVCFTQNSAPVVPMLERKPYLAMKRLREMENVH